MSHPADVCPIGKRDRARKGQEITKDMRCKTSAKTQACLHSTFGLDKKKTDQLTRSVSKYTTHFTTLHWSAGADTLSG